jgi:hypothetical protein
MKSGLSVQLKLVITITVIPVIRKKQNRKKQKIERQKPPVFKSYKIWKTYLGPMNKKEWEKWIVPTYMYSKSFFPLFLSGSGYIMSLNVAECLLQKSKVSFL